jgi:hypothetical protein
VLASPNTEAVYVFWDICMSNEIAISALIRDVYSRGQKNWTRYRVSHLTSKDWKAYPYLRYPVGPAETIYRSMLEENGEAMSKAAYRATGADLGFLRTPQQQPEGRDIRDWANAAGHRSYEDGFNLFFPAEGIKKYMEIKLAEPAFRDTDPENIERYRQGLLTVLPRTSAAAKIAARIGKNPALAASYYSDSLEGPYSFRDSLERDFIDEPPLGVPLSDKSRQRTDRKILHNQELHNAYRFSLHRPELWLGFTLWKELIEGYAQEMFKHHQHEAFEVANRLSYREPIIQAAKDPKTGFFASVAGSIGVMTFELFCIPHILDAARTESGVPQDGPLKTKHINAGIAQTKENGALLRTFHVSDGTRRTVVCPFSEHFVPFLTMDLSQKDGTATSSLASCYRKIIDEGNNPTVKAYRTAMQSALKTVIAESEAGMAAVTNGPNAASKPAAHGNDNRSSRCPFHNKAG